MLPPRGYLFISLNVIRLLSVIGLLLVFSSNVVVLANDIKAVNRFVQQGSNNMVMTAQNGTLVDCDLEYIAGSTVPNQPGGIFWAIINRLLIIFETIVLLLSEFNWPQVFFNNFFPILGKDFGMGALGVFECLIGAAVLSHHVDLFPEVSAWFLFVVGCMNILTGLIFRGSGRYRRSITSWKESKKTILPTVSGPVFSPPSFISVPANTTGGSDMTEKSKLGFGRQLDIDKKSALKGFLITKPLETLPKYAPKANGTENSGRGSRASSPSFSSSATVL